MSTQQLVLELTLIGSMFLITGFFLFRSYNSSDALSLKAQKILTGLLGAFLLMAGTVKFFDPFTTMLLGGLRPFQRKVQCKPLALYL
ncbi:hypothetical protein [uncultured Vibrio sp.]|uniref:hypothetical protein n=1 Tax=uncultured Vibrio sp. TaxID=114054 RepID=UPI0026397A34|nr:hypothetical protein [uncultured Vibrio sp.]